MYCRIVILNIVKFNLKLFFLYGITKYNYIYLLIGFTEYYIIRLLLYYRFIMMLIVIFTITIIYWVYNRVYTLYDLR